MTALAERVEIAREIAEQRIESGQQANEGLANYVASYCDITVEQGWEAVGKAAASPATPACLWGKQHDGPSHCSTRQRQTCTSFSPACALPASRPPITNIERSK